MVVKMLRVPVEVATTSWPSLTVVMTVTNSCSEVATRSLVLTTAEVREAVGARVVVGPSELGCADEAGTLLLSVEAGGFDDWAGAAEVLSVVGLAAGAVVGGEEAVGRLVDAGARVVVAADVGDAPVPAAWRFWP